MSFGIIYKAENKVNGKVYIGQTTKTLRRRMKRHINESNSKRIHYHFHKAIIKYGNENFVWSLLKKCSNREELDKMEEYYITKYNSIKEGYNMVGGGGVMNGWAHSEKTKQTISEKAKKRHRENGHPNKGRKWSESVRKRMSESKKGRIISEKQRNEHSIRMSGKGNPMYGMSGPLAPTSKFFVVEFPNGDKKIVKGLRKFCEDNCLTLSCMYNCVNGRQRQHKGFKCYYMEEDS